MYINNLKVNGYGKLEGKEINLNKGINVIKGDNEAGKSTLLNFITSMFYGASRNKNGREMSDYERYKPWNAEEYSGKIKYTLDNSDEFEVFRDFNKKNPKIYNKNLEEIQNNFNIDKTKGNQFFLEQTGIDESIFSNTMSVCQDEVVLDNSKQNILIQKITNIVSSGDDNTSYKKTMDKLNKKLLDEVGTNRTSERPMNIIEEEIIKIENDKNSLDAYKIQLQNIESEEQRIKNQLTQTDNTLNILKEIKDYKQKEILQEQKIGINTNKLNEYNKKLNELMKNKKQEEVTSKKSLNPIFALIVFIVIILGSLILKNAIITVVLGFVLGIGLLFNYYEYNKYKKTRINQKEEEIKYNKELEIIQETIKQCSKEIENDRQEIEKRQMQEKQLLINKYGINNDIDNYLLEEQAQINTKVEQIQNGLNAIRLRENTLSVEKDNIHKNLEELVKKDERLQYLYEQRLDLKKLANCINLAQIGLEEAYTIMKNTITPKFTNELTNIIKNITNDKYKKVKFNDEDGLTVELNNGEYINCNRLSIGAIDQMYLALRISILNEISKETMPIVLDESFAFYDAKRLENILKYISNEYYDRQIIILTCANREIDLLNNLNIQYNLITL